MSLADPSPTPLPGEPPSTQFALVRDEPPGIGLRRIAIEQIDLVLWHVRRAGEAAEHVHELRKGSKRVRALLRMARGVLGNEGYRRDNAALRDVARQFSTLRTTTVLLDLLETLSQSRPELSAAAGALGGRLAAQEERLAVAMFTESWLLGDLSARVERTRAEVAAWELSPELDPTAHGLRQTYRRGRRAMRRAHESGAEDRLHAWRKQVKYLRHQLEILDVADPGASAPSTQEVAELGETLGLEHDLAELEAVVVATPDAFSTDRQRATLLEALGDHRRTLLVGMQPLAARIYGESPADFTRRLHLLWEASR